LNKRTVVPLLLLLFAVVVCTLWVPEFGSPTNVRNVLVQSVPLLLTSVGQTLVIITAGIDLSIGAVVTFSVVLASWLMQPEYGGIWVGVLGCVAAGLAIGVANALMVVRLDLPPFLATLATMFLLDGLSLTLRPVMGGSIPTEFRSVATASLGPAPLAPVVTLAVLIALAVHLSRSRFGLRLHAVGGDERKARLAGVSAGNVKFVVYVVASVLASIAGLFLAARVGIGDPNVGGTYQFDSITASVLGGTSLAGGLGTLWGAIAGALGLQIIGNSLNLLGVVAYWQWILKGSLLVIAVAAYSARRITWPTNRLRGRAPGSGLLPRPRLRMHGRD